MLETDVNNADQKLWVEFYPGNRPNEFRSKETGKPEFDLIDFIRITVPGDPNNIVERPIRDSDKMRWPTQWAAYKNNQAYRPTTGTPIDEWPRIDSATCAKLKALEFHTVEQIADASDAQIQNIGMGAFELRTRASAFIKAAKDSSYAQKLAEDLAERDQQISDQNDLIKKMGDRLELLEADREKPVRRQKEAA